MGSDRSAVGRRVLPLSAALAVFTLGIIAMPQAKYLAALGFRIALLCSEALLVTPAVIALPLFGIPLSSGLGLRLWTLRIITLSLAAGISLWGASLGLFELQNVFWRPPEWYLDAFRRIHELLRPAGLFDAAISVVAIAVAPAVCEEILFRGVVLPSFAKRLGPLLGLAFSAGLFGLIHFDAGGAGQWSLYRVPFACAVGLALGALRITTGSLVPSILSHATLNTITFVAAPFADDPNQNMSPPNPLFGLALFFAGCAGFGLLFRLFRTRQAI